MLSHALTIQSATTSKAEDLELSAAEIYAFQPQTSHCLILCSLSVRVYSNRHLVPG